ncbi:MAG: flagellar hook capping FlgD N-terminal domain-containing protein [Phycisphaeraceae bacterium]
MPTDMISNATSGAGGSAAAASAAQGFGDLDSQEFMKILLSELTNQDPMEPTDSAQILEQLSSLRNIESQMNLQTQLKSLVLQNQISQASGLIGKLVEGVDADNNRVAGTVTSVRVKGNDAMLELDTGKSLPIKRVEQITNAVVAQMSDLLG